MYHYYLLVVMLVLCSTVAFFVLVHYVHVVVLWHLNKKKIKLDLRTEYIVIHLVRKPSDDIHTSLLHFNFRN